MDVEQVLAQRLESQLLVPRARDRPGPWSGLYRRHGGNQRGARELRLQLSQGRLLLVLLPRPLILDPLDLSTEPIQLLERLGELGILGGRGGGAARQILPRCVGPVVFAAESLDRLGVGVASRS